MAGQGGRSTSASVPAIARRDPRGSRASHCDTASASAGGRSRPSTTSVGTGTDGRANALTSAARRGEDGSSPAPASDGARAKAAATPGVPARARASQPPRPWPPTTSGRGPQREARLAHEPARVVEHLGAEAPAARALAARLPGDDLEPLRHRLEDAGEPAVVEGHSGVEVEDEADAGLVPGREPTGAQARLPAEPHVLNQAGHRGHDTRSVAPGGGGAGYRPISSAIGTSASITKATCSSRGRPRASAPP